MESAQSLVQQGFFDVLTVGLRSSGQLRELLTEAATRQQLSELESRVLWICHREQTQGASQAAFAKELETSPAHVSALVEDLRQRGFVVSERRPPDRRRQYWSLSAAGQSRFLPLLRQLDAVIRESRSVKPAAERFSAAAENLVQTLAGRASAKKEEKLSNSKAASQPANRAA